MKKIIFLTGNAHKVQEANFVLEPLGFKVEQMHANIPEIQELSLQKIIEEKAKHARIFVPTDAVMIEDTGFYLDAYNNFPGPLGKFVFKGIGFSGLLKLVEETDKTVHFKTLIAYIPQYEEKPIFFEGICKGKITAPSGQPSSSMPFDAIFIPEGHSETFLQLPASLKNEISHRALAFKALALYLKESEDKK